MNVPSNLPADSHPVLNPFAEFGGINPSEDPELAQVMKLSIEEEKRRTEQEERERLAREEARRLESQNISLALEHTVVADATLPDTVIQDNAIQEEN